MHSCCLCFSYTFANKGIGAKQKLVEHCPKRKPWTVWRCKNAQMAQMAMLYGESMEIESFFMLFPGTVECMFVCCLSGPLNMNGCHACGLHAPSINSIEWTRPMPRMTLGTKTHVRHLATLILQKALRCQKSACSTPISGHRG